MRLHIINGDQQIEVRLVFQRPFAIVRIVRLFKHWGKAGRTPGLHAGAYQVGDDFDDPLPDDFLIKSQ